MKRSSALAHLSREHHAALVWALRALRADSHSARELMANLVQVFESELEPHFNDEEVGLLPALKDAGEAALVEHTLADHQLLRATMQRVRAGDVSAVAEFGKALQAHVRFEERELFPIAEQRLSAAQLAAIVEQGVPRCT